MAYKRELIINNGSLTSYKKLLKVSDVCQLLDKSKYPATQTVNGVTYTNNGDGTITISGRATDTNFYPIGRVPLTITHLYYMGRTSYTGGYCKMEIHNGVRQIDSYGDGIILVCEKTTESTIYIDTYAGEELNIVYKPQLFDLTEMYGAGNEPKTVAEFKAKFPNELYNYSPRCWVTSYKTGLIAKTKNLLSEINPWINTKIENGVVHQNTADARELDPRKVQLYNGNTFVKGWNGDNQQIGKNTFTFTTDVLPTHTQIVFGLNGQAIDTTVTTPITLEDNTTYTLSMDFINITQGEIAWTNSMLEKGTTATDYVPYGYL